MNEWKSDLTEFFSKLAGKSYGWLSRLLNRTDHTLTKVMEYVGEKKATLDQYLIDRTTLLASIENAHHEVDRLKKEIDETKQDYESRRVSLLEKLAEQTENLMSYQKEYAALEKAAEQSKLALSQVEQEKENAVHERNFLKSEYDHLKTIIDTKTEELAAFRSALDVLKSSSSSTDEEIEAKEKQIIELEYYYREQLHAMGKLQEQLTEKMKEVAKLSGQLQKLETLVEKQDEQAILLKHQITKVQSDLEKEQAAFQSLKYTLVLTEEKMKRKERQAREAEQLASLLEQELLEKERLFKSNMDDAADELIRLEEELMDVQNKAAEERAKYAEQINISPEVLETLQQEYEPRFKVLYTNSVFTSNFFNDFYSLNPSERLKVEATIVRLNTNFDVTMSSVRPKTVRTGGRKALLEFEFGQDKAGRIYFRKDDGKVHFYRLSRTKNGGRLSQKHVIEWLKRNKV